MFDRLPHELALLILEHAVNLLLASDRTSLVHLAQISKTVYGIVAPQMYRSICVPNGKASRLLAFADEDSPTRSLADRVFIHARSLHMVDFDTSKAFGKIFQRLEYIESHVEVIDVIATACEERRMIDGGISTTLRSVHLCCDTCDTITRVPGLTLMGITHLCGYMVDPEFGGLWHTFLADPSDWMATLMDKLPALTHLGLNLYCSTVITSVVEAFDLSAFAKTIHTALATRDRCLSVVAVRVTGRYINRWDEILSMLQGVESGGVGTAGRIRAWRDDRVQDDWDECIMSNAAANRTIWTESLPVASLG